MAVPNNARPQAFAAPSAAATVSHNVTPDLEDELRRAAEDFERGDYIELTAEQLDHCIATGESPWPTESRG